MMSSIENTLQLFFGDNSELKVELVSYIEDPADISVFMRYKDGERIRLGGCDMDDLITLKENLENFIVYEEGNKE